MMPHDIIRKPLFTEKSTTQKEVYNQLSFEVAPSANKIEIRRAVQNVFGVKVLDVRTMQVKGKVKRIGRSFGRRRNWKKAIVSLAPGSRVEFFEGA